MPWAGLWPRAADRSGIQFRTLNARKGPAVRATRAQIDRSLYKGVIRPLLEQADNLHLFQQAVDDLVIEGDSIRGVVTQTGLRFHASCVVLTAGTFLAGRIHVGETGYQGGRAGEPPANTLAASVTGPAFQDWAVEDRYAAATRRQDHRLQSTHRATGRRPNTCILVYGNA